MSVTAIVTAMSVTVTATEKETEKETEKGTESESESESGSGKGKGRGRGSEGQLRVRPHPRRLRPRSLFPSPSLLLRLTSTLLLMFTAKPTQRRHHRRLWSPLSHQAHLLRASCTAYRPLTQCAVFYFRPRVPCKLTGLPRNWCRAFFVHWRRATSCACACKTCARRHCASRRPRIRLTLSSRHAPLLSAFLLVPLTCARV